MLILLPPSEGKTPATAGDAVDWTTLSFPRTEHATGPRCWRGSERSAPTRTPWRCWASAPRCGPTSNATRGCTPSRRRPAHQVYSGVLYDALGYDSLTPAQRRKADDSVLVISALWGAIRFGDRVPAYRLSMATALPDVGRLASFWKPQLTGPSRRPRHGELLVDCRSSTYAAAWAPPPAQTVAVNVFTEVDGVRKVVSHFAKHTRGELARHLLTRRGKAPQTPRSCGRRRPKSGPRNWSRARPGSRTPSTSSCPTSSQQGPF